MAQHRKTRARTGGRGKWIKRFSLGTSVALVASMSSLALAAWLTNGFGSFAVAAGTPQNVTFTQYGSISGLQPGGTATVRVFAHNPNSYPVAFTTPAAIGTPGVTVDPAHSACNVDALAFTPANPFSVTVPPGTSGAYTIGTVTLDNGASTACEGAVFTVSFFASGASAATPSGTAETNLAISGPTANLVWTSICNTPTTSRMRIVNNSNGYIPAGALSYQVVGTPGSTVLGSTIPQGGSIIVDVAGAGPSHTIILSFGAQTNTKAVNATSC